MSDIPLCERCRKPLPQRQRFAYTAVIISNAELAKAGMPRMPRGLGDGSWIIGRADEGTTGYTPMPTEGLFVDEEKARERAKVMNKHVGWMDEADAQMLVLRTMPMKEEHLAGLLGRAVTLLTWVREDEYGITPKGIEIGELIEDCKGYAKEEV